MPKWTNPTIAACIAMCDILSSIYRRVVADPADLPKSGFGHLTDGELFDFGEKTLNDHSLWESLPETLIPNREEVARVQALLADTPKISTLDGESTEKAKKRLMEGFCAGESRDKLREQLKSLLDRYRA